MTVSKNRIDQRVNELKLTSVWTALVSLSLTKGIILCWINLKTYLWDWHIYYIYLVFVLLMSHNMFALTKHIIPPIPFFFTDRPDVYTELDDIVEPIFALYVVRVTVQPLSLAQKRVQRYYHLLVLELQLALLGKTGMLSYFQVNFGDRLFNP